MTEFEVNVFATVGMSVTVKEMSATAASTIGGNVRDRGEIKYILKDLRVAIFIHNFA